jgi:hypothetical protein
MQGRIDILGISEACDGSAYFGLAFLKCGNITLNQRVPGSSPGAPTKLIKHLQVCVSERTFRFDVRFEKFARRPYACQEWRDGCALPQRLTRSPAAWSTLSRRSLGDRGRLHLESIHIPISFLFLPVFFAQLLDR